MSTSIVTATPTMSAQAFQDQGVTSDSCHSRSMLEILGVVLGFRWPVSD